MIRSARIRLPVPDEAGASEPLVIDLTVFFKGVLDED